MPPQTVQNVDMGAIREALQRRLQGEGGTPALEQLGTPIGPNPLTGGIPTPASPTPRPTEVPPAVGVPRIPRPETPTTARVGTDDETKRMSKALITKLLQFL